MQSDSIQARLFAWYIAYLIKYYVNLEQIFWWFILMHMNLKMVSWSHWNAVSSYC